MVLDEMLDFAEVARETSQGPRPCFRKVTKERQFRFGIAQENSTKRRWSTAGQVGLLEQAR